MRFLSLLANHGGLSGALGVRGKVLLVPPDLDQWIPFSYIDERKDVSTRFVCFEYGLSCDVRAAPSAEGGLSERLVGWRRVRGGFEDCKTISVSIPCLMDKKERSNAESRREPSNNMQREWESGILSPLGWK